MVVREWVAADRPYLGICLGMQLAVIEYARHMCGLTGANSTSAEAPMIPSTPPVPSQGLAPAE